MKGSYRAIHPWLLGRNAYAILSGREILDVRCNRTGRLDGVEISASERNNAVFDTYITPQLDINPPAL